MSAPALAPDAPARPSVARTVLPPLAAIGVLVAVLWPHAGEMWESARLVSWEAGLALVGLHLVALILRAEAWAMCVAAAGSPVARPDLHASSAFRFLADTIVPTYVGAWVRVAILKKLDSERAPTVGQMVTADVILLLVEAGITLVLITIAVGNSSVDWWWVPAFAGLLAAVALVGWLLRHRFAERPFAKTFLVLRGGGRTVRLTALLVVVLLLQPIRFWLALEAVGLEPTAIEALVTFLITSVYGVLPVGPGPSSIGAATTVFGSGNLAQAGAAGLILASTAVVAAALYSVYGAITLSRRARGTPSIPAGTGR